MHKEWKFLLPIRLRQAELPHRIDIDCQLTNKKNRDLCIYQLKNYKLRIEHKPTRIPGIKPQFSSIKYQKIQLIVSFVIQILRSALANWVHMSQWHRVNDIYLTLRSSNGMHPTILFLQLHYYILSCQSYKKVLKRRPNYIKVHSPEKHTRIFSDIAGDEPAGRGGGGGG
jgi:hypothetical protein